MQKIWPFSLSFLFFAGVAFVMPFMVLYYQSLGFSGAQIGILVGLFPLITLFSSPFWTGLADSTHRHRFFLSLALLVGAGATAVLPFLHAFLPVLVMGVVFSVFSSPISAFADSATMFMLAGQKEMYGRIRVGGTIGFGMAALLAGFIVQNYGLKFAFWGGGLIYLLALLVSQKLVYDPATGTAVSRLGAFALLKNRRWLIFLSLALAGGLAASVTNSYLFPFMKDLGASEGIMGLALTIGTLSEFPVFFFGNWLLKRFKSRPLLNLALVITGLRLLALSFSTSPMLVLATQLLNGVSFSAMWMAGVSYADENAPLGMSASAQGLFGAAVYGFGAAIGGFAGGLLLENLGGHGMFLVCGLAVLATILIVSLIEGRIPLELRKARGEI
jgi:MFS transporter, PPP family, 3-phenylpropionic acid transporter